VYGRGFVTLCSNGLKQLAKSTTAPTLNRTLTAIDNLGETAAGLADEDGKLTSLRDQLEPGSATMSLEPSKGAIGYVEHMSSISNPPNDPFLAFVCSWTMGKVCYGIANRRIY